MSGSATAFGYKMYVKVGVEYSEDGIMRPLYVITNDGLRYEVTRVRNRVRAASTKAGGCGIKYTVTINGTDANLYYEDAEICRWFVELKRPVQVSQEAKLAYTE